MRTAAVLLLLLVAQVAEAGQAALAGVVRDESGAVISGASVVATFESGVSRRTVTGPEGRFTVQLPAVSGTLTVRSVGFAEFSQPITGGGEVDIVLRAASVLESVTVTPSRTEQRLGDVPASVSIVDKETIRSSPAVVIDDVLRRVPTFSLFRRTSSLAAHPTAQGVSLRGIGPSGVSRSLVLYDGVPFNDPFGGWVYWTRIPMENVERVEVVDTNSSNTYGNYAMGGVINVVSARPQPRTLELRTQYGNNNSPKADFFGSDTWGRVGAAVTGSIFRTDGFPIVRAAERGPIDTQAAVDYQNVNVKIDFTPTERINGFVRGGYFSEERDNAKVSTFSPVGQVVSPAQGTAEANDTIWKTVNAGIRASLPDQSSLQASVFADFERFNSNFLAVPNTVTRTVGRLSLLQRVPTTGVGTLVQWSKPIAQRHLFSAGFDLRHVDGASLERTLDAVTGTTQLIARDSGGTQLSSGAYVQGQFWALPNLSFTVAGRVDHWRNYNARNLETTLATGLPTAASTTFADKESSVVSPRAAVLYQVTGRVSAFGSIGQGFRAPTLNELYRQFRVGAILTNANPQLGPERLLGGEVGLNVAPIEALTIRTAYFDNRMKDPVANVTVDPANPNVRQRQNVGRTQIRGFQTDVEYRLGTDWRVGGGYMLNDGTVTENRDPILVGKTLAQVPRHRGSMTLTYANARVVTLSASAMFFGRQFDDDLNVSTLPGASEPGLPGYAAVDFSASRTLTRNLDAFFGVQNLFDEEYYVGFLPTTIGTPRLINGGIRVRFARR